MDVLALVARILVVPAFLSAGLMGHLGPGRQMLTGYAASQKIPAAGPVVVISGVWIVVGSLSVLFGIYGDVGALMLAIFTVLTATLIHTFWRIDDEEAKAMDQIQFNKDLALAGGALALFVVLASQGDNLGLTITGSLFEL